MRWSWWCVFCTLLSTHSVIWLDSHMIHTDRGHVPQALQQLSAASVTMSLVVTAVLPEICAVAPEQFDIPNFDVSAPQNPSRLLANFGGYSPTRWEVKNRPLTSKIGQILEFN